MTQLIRVGHSPDPDDAFMFYALAKDKIDTGPYRFEHELVDIETLNRRAFPGELELTALSLHAYAHLTDKYVLCSCGASMGDKYGPMVVANEKTTIAALADKTIAVPGTLTTAFLALPLCLGRRFQARRRAVRRNLERRRRGRVQGSADRRRPHHSRRPAHLPARRSAPDRRLSANGGSRKPACRCRWAPTAIRKDLGPQAIPDVNRLLKESIKYGLDHRGPALDYALRLTAATSITSKADKFVGMYVNDWTLDFGPRGREAVTQLLARGHACGVIPKLVKPEFL